MTPVIVAPYDVLCDSSIDLWKSHVTVITRPRRPEAEHDRDLEQRVADLEALIEEARRRARRRRMRNAAALVVAASTAAVGLIGFGGWGGGGAGRTALADRSGTGGPTRTPAPPLAALPAGARPQAFAFDPRRPNVVYVASAHDRGGVYVYKTSDSGRHWQPTAARGTGWISDILSLTADPQRPGTLYAGTDTAVYKTEDGGRTWRPFKQGLFPPNGDHHIIGTPGTTTWNRGNGWVLDIAVDPSSSRNVYSASDAVRKSTDGGRTWKTVLQPPTPWSFVTRIAIARTRPESIYAIVHTYTNGTAIYKSTDAGRTWQVTGGSAASLPPSYAGDSQDALAVDAGNPQTIYAAVGDTVLATTDGGANWQPMANGLPANDITSLAVDPQRSGTVYASVVINLNRVTSNAAAGAIYKTTDGGQTWSEIFSGLGVEKVAVDPARPSTVYGEGWAGRSHPNVFHLLRSTDGGRTWTSSR
jgi:photosystem II stability/assembly factor-like uncharacterized protein